MEENRVRLPSSFRDPSGHLFVHNGVLYRHISPRYQCHYQQLERSGLLQELVDRQLLISHTDETATKRNHGAYKIIRPETIPFISYPYEWSFSQLKNAALVTLEVQLIALGHDMWLKDCSAYNIQFRGTKPVLIDTLSFECYPEGSPWVAYRQFCQHFLAPLALMAFADVRMSQLLRVHIDGIPIDLASSLLPRRTYLRFSLLAHIHLHARSQRRFADRPETAKKSQVSRNSLIQLVENLRAGIEKLTWRPGPTLWSDYYGETNYSSQAFSHKQRIVEGMLRDNGTGSVWDLGANTGVFSRIAAAHRAPVVAFEGDAVAAEDLYRQSCKGADDILSLLLDLTNPSPALGWRHEERLSLVQRGPAGMCMALALIHHLAIGNNVPFPQIASFLHAIGDSLVIEFVPKQDSQVQRLLASREDIFDDYHQNAFEESFSRRFAIRERVSIQDSSRTLYLMTGK